jgi:hypothetical protein
VKLLQGKRGSREPEWLSFPHYLLRGEKKNMVAFLVSVIAYVVNVLVAFGTDGSWKTAGLALTQPYWTRVQR